MKKLFALVCMLCAVAAVAFAQDRGRAPIRVEVKAPQQVQDPLSGEKWMQIEVVLDAAENTHPSAIDKNFFEKVTVTPTFAWGSKKKGSFSISAAFSATAQVAALPAKQKRSVYFYIPADVVAAYKLNSPITFYYVAVSYAGTELPATKESVSPSMHDALEYVGDFVNACGEKTSKTKGMLLPHNLVPGYMIYTTNANKVSRSIATLVSPLELK